MAIIQKFSAVDKAVLVSTGNTLVICGSNSEPVVNTSDLIKADGTTTRNWQENGSSANLDILNNSTILYAELVWYSTVFSNVLGALDLRSLQDTPITFTTSKGSYQITPESMESYVAPSGSVDRYRAANVTMYVKEALSGSYTVSKVPISIPETGLSNSRGGWALSVIYRNDLLRPQKVLYNSGVMAATPELPLQSTVTGFTTSSDPNYLKGSMTMIVANGGPLNGTEVVKAGPSFAQLTNIGNPVYSPNPNPGTAPNNPGNSFFSGVINIADPLNSSDGLLNINGTNGNNNNDGFVPIQKVGARNKWDITNVSISNTLVANQTLIAQEITTGTVGDGVQLLGLGAQVYAKAPNIIATLEAYDIDGDSQYNVEVFEPQVYAIKIRNEGDEEANNVIVSAILNSSTSFIEGSVIINGVSNPLANIVNGFNVGTISARGIVTIFFTVKVNSVPTGGILYQNVNYSYQFLSGLDIITNNGSTNTIELIVQEGRMSVSKIASKANIAIGEKVTYTINIENVGTELTREVFIQDKLDLNSVFVEGTVKINGVAYTDYNPTIGFSLPNMEPLSVNQIEFQVKVNSIPLSTKINNVCYVNFGYIFNQLGYLRKKTAVSNSTSITVQYTDIIAERCNNNNYPNISDIVIYTLSLTNIGNIPAANVQVLEPAILGATFVDGSVKINGVAYENLNPFTGFTLTNDIQPQQTTDIEYKVLINSLNPESLIENTANVPFKYQIIPGGTIIDAQKDSNTVDTVANYVCINTNKTVNTPYSQIGDTLYYKINITNSGNINATDTVFLDVLQSNISFISGTVAINGVPYTQYNPIIGFSVGTICPNDIIEVTFNAKVNTIPENSIVYNTASLVYQYKPDPNGSTLTNTVFTNTVETTINEAKYTVVKSVDKAYAQLGDYLVYTTIIENIGNVALTDIKFVDFIGVFLEFNVGTVYIDGINYPTYNPNNQFALPNMNPADRITVTFSAKILENPYIGYIPNMSEVTLSFKQNPDSPIITKTVYSNEVKTYTPVAKIDLIGTVDKQYAVVSDTLTYSFTASNNGNTTAINTLFTDNIQQETSLVPGSVTVNGVSKPTYDPTIGYTLGTMYMGQVVTTEFQVTVDSVPSPNVIENSAIASYSYYVDPNNQPVAETTTSNIISTTVNSYSANVSKAVNKNYATIGDILDYTVTVFNTGTVSLTNVNFKDIVPNGATFVLGSVYLDGVNKPDFNPNTGFAITDVVAGGSVVVMFKAEVTSLPSPAQINNKADITFKYRLTPTSPDIDEALTSNIVTTNINSMRVTNTKSVSKNYATINDILTYTSVISNDGNVSIENTNFIDSIVSDASFVEGSVEIDGVPYALYNPNNGFTLGTITAGGSKTVTFNVKVESIPSDGVILNTSNLDYQYKIDPSKPYIISNSTSNTVSTYINYGDLTITKASNRTITRLNNIITYNFVIANTGNTILQNLLFKDIIQLESTFNAGSVFVNGVNKPTYNPVVGFNLDNIDIGSQTKISFTVTTNSIPSNNELLNNATINYSYYVDPQGEIINKSKTSNTTLVNVYDTIISADKIVDKSIAKIGENLNFTISIKNDGNVLAQHGIFKDILDSNLSFVSDSVYINGILKPGFNPNIGFSIEDIPQNETVVISFSATVISRPTNNIIYNFGEFKYDYIVGSETIYATMNTNITETLVATGELSISKYVNKSYSTVGDNISYLAIIRNTGSVNATNLIFKDLILSPSSFNDGTVIVDGVSKPLFNPNIGFVLSDLAPNNYHVVSFSIHVDSLPQSGEIDNTSDVTFTYKLSEVDLPVTTTAYSNTVITLINIANLTGVKTVDKAYATIGDTINYSITLNNTGNATAFDMYFQDIIQSNASFIEGSVKINGVSYANYNPNIGFNLDNIIGGESLIVTFSAKVDSLPQDYTIYNIATDSYKYYINPTAPPILREVQTNTVETEINVANLSATKYVSKAYATINDKLTYTINIVNLGNTVAKNVNFRDVIPTGLQFVDGSVKINGILYPTFNPYSSFTLGTIIPGDTVLVTFDAIVKSLPNPSLISNTANITFEYRVNPNGPDIPVITNSNSVTTQINLGSLSLVKSVDKAYTTMGDVLTYTVVVTNNGNVRADNVLFIDSLQSDVTFNLGSVKVDGVTYADYNPNVGFNIGNIESLNSITVTFKATVIANPINSSVLNYAIASMSYKIDPNGQYYNKSYQSNTVSTILVKPKLTSTKFVNKTYATLQDELSYTIQVKNEGNTTISQMAFIDYLSNGAIFKTGSVKVNGISYPDYNPLIGFGLPNLISGNTSLIEFKATINSMPSPAQITNYAISNGSYYVDPQGALYPISTTSNTVTTNVNVGSLTNVKVVDKVYARIDDVIKYTSTITNTGTVNATNLFFTDILQSGLTFILGSVSIDNVIYPLLNPTLGFQLSNLAVGQSVTVSFTAKVNSLPTPAYVTNNSNIQFSYKIDPAGSTITKDQLSNSVVTNIVVGKITAAKIVDKPIATIGDELNYTITLTNTGNVIDNNVLFQDTPSVGSIFKAGSVKINNVSQPSYDPTLGFNLGNIDVGNVVTVQFIASVVSVPETNQVTNQATVSFEYYVNPQEPFYNETVYSNTVTTNIALGNLSVTKAVNKKYATIGEQITYTIVIENIGNVNATNVIFKDPTPNNTVFVIGSVSINGVSYPTYNPSAGFNLNTIIPGQIVTVVYNVQLINLC